MGLVTTASTPLVQIIEKVSLHTPPATTYPSKELMFSVVYSVVQNLISIGFPIGTKETGQLLIPSSTFGVKEPDSNEQGGKGNN